MYMVQLLKEVPCACFYCGQGLSNALDAESHERLTWDHIVPVSKGGLNAPPNVVPSCRDCQNRKANKPLDQFRADFKTRDFWIERRGYKIIIHGHTGALVRESQVARIQRVLSQ